MNICSAPSIRGGWLPFEAPERPGVPADDHWSGKRRAGRGALDGQPPVQTCQPGRAGAPPAFAFGARLDVLSWCSREIKPRRGPGADRERKYHKILYEEDHAELNTSNRTEAVNVAHQKNLF